MARSESLPVPAPPVAQTLPMESFLATDDPAWVWDGQGRRILWANAAAARLWGDRAPDRLKRRRLGATDQAPARLTELARMDLPLPEHAETLAIPTPEGIRRVACVLQRLALAGGRPGLVVRALIGRGHPKPSDRVRSHRPTGNATPGSRKARVASGRAEPQPERRNASRTNIGVLRTVAEEPAKAAAPWAAQEAQPSPASAPPRPVPGPQAPSREDMAALLARVSHEIRNPLTIILGFAEILQSERAERLKPGKAREYASDIYRTAQLALGLADDLLGFAERASGEPPPAHSWMNLNAVISDCLHLLEPLASAHRVALARSLKRDSPLLLAHERSIRQVLLNLLMNALRHGEGGGTIRVSTRLDRQGGLVLSVKDDGPGMSAEQIAAAKAPELAGDVKQAGRRGLGLRLVVGFVRDNGGELDIISKPGTGADVRIRFSPERLRAPKRQPAAKKPASANPQGRKPRPTRVKRPSRRRA